MANVLYWAGISCFNLSDFVQHKGLIEKLLLGQTKSADVDLKRVGQSRIYSARINDADRLLFTTVNGKLLLLEVILNHDYQKSRFLKPKVVKIFMNKHQDEFGESIDVYDFIDAKLDELNVDVEASEQLCLNFQPVTRYNGQFLQLSQEQFSACQIPYPMLVIGPPGSGKSLLAVELLNQASRTYASNNQRPIACVCYSAGVRDHLRMQWQQANIAIEDGCEVVFLTVDELFGQLLEQAPSAKVKGFNEVGKIHCQAFINAHQQHIKKLVKAKTMATCEAFLNSDANLIYQEFYIMAGFTEDEYLAKGQRATLFTEVGDRKAVFATFEKYKEQLIAEGAIHPAFAVWPITEVMFQKIIVDEAQDLSLFQLQQLFNLTEDSQIACAMDPHQSLTVSHSLRSGLQQLLMQAPTPLSTIKLSTTHRCPTIVANMANKVLAIKNFIFDGVLDRRELTQIDTSDVEKDGSINWQDKEPPFENIAGEIEQICLLYGLNKSQVALIVPEELLAVAEARQELDLVFSASSIKGLEFPCVIVYSPCRKLAKLNSHLAGVDEQSLGIKNSRTRYEHASQNKQADRRNKQYAVDLNALFVSLTRTSQYLVIWQAYGKNLSRLINHLKNVLTLKAEISEEGCAEVKNVNHNTEASEDDWNESCLKLYSAGNTAAAERVYNNNLQKILGHDFKHFLDDAYGRHKQPDSNEETIEKPLPEAIPEKVNCAAEDKIAPYVEARSNHQKQNSAIAVMDKLAKSSDTIKPKLNASSVPSVNIQTLSQIKQSKEIKVFISLFEKQGLTSALLDRLYQSDMAIEILFKTEFCFGEKAYSSLIKYILSDTQRMTLFHERLKCSNNIDLRSCISLFLKAIYSKFFTDKNAFSYSSLSADFRATLLLDRLKKSSIPRINKFFSQGLSIMKNDWAWFLYENNLLGCLLDDNPILFDEPFFQNSFHFPRKAGSVFYAICAEQQPGEDFFARFFELHKSYLSQERLHAASVIWGGMTPFYHLCLTESGINLIRNEWEFFEKIITIEGLNHTINSTVEKHNRTPFTALLLTTAGLMLLKDKWPFFKSKVGNNFMVTPRQVIKANKACDAELPLYHCLTSDAGLDLVESDMEYFIKPLAEVAFFHSPKIESFKYKDSCFYLLCTTEAGRRFLIKYWYQYFKNIIPESALRCIYSYGLCLELLKFGYGIGQTYACENVYDKKYSVANKFYLLALTNIDFFLEYLDEDIDNEFIYTKMANGKSVLVNLSEQSYFNCDLFERDSYRFLENLKDVYQNELAISRREDITIEKIVVWYHLACTIDAQTNVLDLSCLTNLFNHLWSRDIELMDVIKSNVPSTSMTTYHLFHCVYALKDKGNLALFKNFWPYLKSFLITQDVSVHYDLFQHVCADGFAVELLVDSYQEFNDVCADPLHALIMTEAGLRHLGQFWDKIAPHVTKAKLHEVHAELASSPFDELASTVDGFQFIVEHWSFFKDKLEPRHIADKYTPNFNDIDPISKAPKIIYLKDMLEQQHLHLAPASTHLSASTRRRKRKNQSKAAAIGFFATEAKSKTPDNTEQASYEISANIESTMV